MQCCECCYIVHAKCLRVVDCFVRGSHRQPLGLGFLLHALLLHSFVNRLSGTTPRVRSVPGIGIFEVISSSHYEKLSVALSLLFFRAERQL